MRKLYRAFPELDQFSDEQCEEFVKRAKHMQGFGDWAIAAVTATALVSCLVLAILQYFLSGALQRAAISLAGRAMAQHLYPAAIVFLWVVVPALSALVGRDVVYWRFLKRAIWKRIELIRCGTCKYSLLGQHVRSGVVRCPECGEATTLTRLGVDSEADLMPPAELHSPVR
jgi:hypothetical protein